MKMLKIKDKTNFAFTLAEVLVTLAVIGVIASVTIPTLLQSTNQAELKTKWKKVYSDLSQVYIQLLNENSGSLKGAFPGDAAGSEDLKNAFVTKLNVIKDCSGNSGYGGNGTGCSAEGCWHNVWYWLHGGVIGAHLNPGVILNNGVLILFSNQKSDCSYSEGNSYSWCGRIYVDVNGFKKPNTIGKDIFWVNLTEDAFVPYGARDSWVPESSCVEGATETTNTGVGCSALYLYE